MSHYTTIETEIRDLDALRDACRELNLDLLPQTEARGYGANRLPADHVIRLKGPYDIAVTRAKDGPATAYNLTCDWWGGHVAQEVGDKFSRLVQLYAVHKATREARRKRYSVRREALKDGSIKLLIGLPFGAATHKGALR